MSWGDDKVSRGAVRHGHSRRCHGRRPAERDRAGHPRRCPRRGSPGAARAMSGGVHAAEADVRGMASCHAGGRASVKPLINRTAGQNVNDGHRCLGGPGRDGVTGVGECRPCRSPALTQGAGMAGAAVPPLHVHEACELTSATVTWPRRGPRPDATNLCHGSAVSLAGWHVRVTGSGDRFLLIDIEVARCGRCQASTTLPDAGHPLLSVVAWRRLPRRERPRIGKHLAGRWTASATGASEPEEGAAPDNETGRCERL